MDIATCISTLESTDLPLKDKPSLLQALHHLSQMIGLTQVKTEVVTQLLFLLSNIKAKGLSHATDSHLLHTLIVGPPGCGKTELGKLLAQIWSSLGILEAASTAEPLTTKLYRDNILLTHSNKQLAEQVERAETAAGATLSKVREMRGKLFALRTLVQKGNEVSMEGMNRLARISADALDYGSLTCKCLESKSEKRATTPVLITRPSASTPFHAVSRINFVAEYVGQTASKTLKLLEDHKGQVLFVDEAYTLYHGDRDTFGSEALTVINQYMTEHSDSTVLIFAGYKESLRNSIFKIQPGLARRFAFTFEIPPYTAEELAAIFRQQLAADGWSWGGEERELIDFFTRHYASFPAWGGDTKRLLFQSKLCFTAVNWQSVERVLNLPVLEAAVVIYKTHQPLTPMQLKHHEVERVYEEEMLKQRLQEHRERVENEGLYTAGRQLEREELERRVKEGERVKEWDKRGRGEYSMYG